jgi:ATP-binding cassette subfamily F protein 3
MTTGEIRCLLGAMLFSGDEVNKRAGVLSGGERARLALATVIAQRNNCLLLDEPTNNLDIIAKETLLEALRRFPGTVVIVSHDRHILNQLVTEVIEVGHGHATRYLGNYDYYLEKQAELEVARADRRDTRAADDSAGRREEAPTLSPVATATKPIPAAVIESPPTAVSDRNGGPAGNHDAARRAERDASRMQARIAKQRAQLEAEIEKCESERAALASEMNDPNFYLARKDANEMITRYERLGREIERLYERLVGADGSAGDAGS